MRISDWSSDVCSSDLEGGDPSEDQYHPADERRGHQWPEDRVVVDILELLPSIRASVGCDIEQLEDRGPELALRELAARRPQHATGCVDEPRRRHPTHPLKMGRRSVRERGGRELIFRGE